MRGLALLPATILGTCALAICAPAGAAGPAKPAETALPTAPSAAGAAQVRAGVDAWSAGNYEAAIKAWQGPAAKGDADALFNLGQAYKLGRGVPKDLVKAEAYYGKAARLGHVQAADNYGIILFQTNRQLAAIPWLQAAADRGEPRAMYVLGIAHYNGDYASKDWVRAYALIARAAATGLPQATASLATMNQTIPLAQRQMGVSLAAELEEQAAQARGRELAAADLDAQGLPVRPAEPRPSPPTPPQRAPAAIETAYLPPSAASEQAPLPEAEPETQPAPAPKPAPKPVQPKPAPPRPAAPATAAQTTPAAKPAAEGGAWRIQLGAFGVKANADALWAKVRGRPEVAGHPRIDIPGTVTRLLAGGYSQSAAQHACAALKAGGLACLVVGP